MPCQCERERTAYHEASHVVIATFLDLEPERVTIEPGAGSLGETIYPGPYGFAWQGQGHRNRIVKRCIVVCYAGFEGERLFCGANANQNQSRGDDGNAFKISREFPEVLPRSVSSIGDEAHDTFLEGQRGQAKRLVRTERQNIEKVAQHLLNKITLTGEEVAKIMGWSS